jgi:hypothetical protein
MPDNESSDQIDPAAMSEAIRQRIKDLDAEVERIKTDPRAKIDAAAITAIRQRIKDLAAAVQQIRGATRED